MASDTKNVKLGVCSVKFNNVDLGYTKGGVEVTVTTETHAVQVDQFGNSPINEYITGRTCKVKVPLAESTLENLVAIMPGATLVTDGVDPLKKKVEVPTGVGINLLDLAEELVLHPKDAGASVADDFTIPKAMTPGALQFAYMLDKERVYEVEFTAYPDATTNKLFIIGDATAAA